MATDRYRYFRVEGRELLDQLSKGFLDLDKGAAAPELIARLLRLAHTLKGAARVVKQKEIADQTHAIEDCLAPFRDSPAAVPREQIDALLQQLDGIAAHLAALSPASDAAAAPLRTPEESPPTVRTDVEEVDKLLEGLTEVGVRFGALRKSAGSLERACRLAQLLDESLSAARATQLNGSALKLRSMATELRGLLEGVERNVSGSAERLDRELTQVRDAAERLRLVPVSLMFVMLERTARDAAQGVGKHVAFVTRGGEVRLDAHVFGAVQSALVQAVRNAVAHGIEVPAERLQAHKPRDGQVSVEVRRRGSRVSFVCRDDGRGVDIEAVRRVAQRQGLMMAEAQSLGAEALLQLLLKGGISTSAAVTPIAGRGIGLDIVREAAQRLGGEVHVRTQAGVGTSLEIVVPVSLAGEDALMVEAAGRTLAIPLTAVRRTLRIGKAEVAWSAERASIVLDGQVIPFAPLVHALRMEVPARDSVPTWSAVVVEGANALAAVGVDRLCGTQSLPFRPLSGAICADAVIAGASLDAQGDPQLVLDPDGLVDAIYQRGMATASASAPRPAVLVIDDSLTTRMLEQSILESAGYEVDVVASAEEALERVKARRYALFLVDVEMHGMDGFTFIERTRADPVLRNVPAILVTSRASPEDRQRGLRVGARAYIVKSEFNQVELLENIRSLVGSQ